MLIFQSAGSTLRNFLLSLPLALLAHSAWAALPIQHWTQPSGAKVYLVESHGIPMLDVQLDFDAGDRRDPADKAGLATIVSRMNRKGLAARPGQPALDENQLSEAWADLGAGLTVSASADRLSFSLRTLSYPDLLPQAVALAARQLGEPSFPEAIWTEERARISAAIREANTRPATQASKAFATAVYGPHPYGYDTTEASLARISVADMRQFYARFIEPCRAKVSYFAPGLHAGAFTIGLQTRPDQAAQAVEVARAVLAKFVADGPTEAELKAAKDNLVGGFALRIDSNAKLLDNVANIAWNNLPLNYLDTWTAQLEKITAADIKAAFARKLQPERMVTVVLGAGA